MAEKKINLGNKGLTELWNLNPDNLEACRAAERDFLPSVENYFEEAIDQQDPKYDFRLPIICTFLSTILGMRLRTPRRG